MLLDILHPRACMHFCRNHCLYAAASCINHQYSTAAHVPISAAASKRTRPSAVVTAAAFSQSHGISPADNVVKECGEEAGIPAEIARTAR